MKQKEKRVYSEMIRGSLSANDKMARLKRTFREEIKRRTEQNQEKSSSTETKKKKEIIFNSI
ncbi:hypothetical protein MFLO_14207 [Listeria floridensis FSL S10-1187]|uniref:Uncharacterized protein n=1 Tax=Listeria floridensis FSL S10-1187 TaxID=1265817 RepID=A0ABP3AW18_9LIST|nr:hypothetical protein MFLO_14207 [Listeria floridensis FSL S10-1187]